MPVFVVELNIVRRELQIDVPHSEYREAYHANQEVVSHSIDIQVELRDYA